MSRPKEEIENELERVAQIVRQSVERSRCLSEDMARLARTMDYNYTRLCGLMKERLESDD